jgi:hypothetical protein
VCKVLPFCPRVPCKITYCINETINLLNVQYPWIFSIQDKYSFKTKTTAALCCGLSSSHRMYQNATVPVVFLGDNTYDFYRKRNLQCMTVSCMLKFIFKNQVDFHVSSIPKAEIISLPILKIIFKFPTCKNCLLLYMYFQPRTKSKQPKCYFSVC